MLLALELKRIILGSESEATDNIVFDNWVGLQYAQQRYNHDCGNSELDTTSMIHWAFNKVLQSIVGTLSRQPT
jgi:hypothetical protein